MPTLTQKITEHMLMLERRKLRLSGVSNTYILTSYYKTIGVTPSMTFSTFIHDVLVNKLPAYESVTRGIRKSRELTPRWKKNTLKIEAEIAHTKKEVGYRNA